MHSRAAASVENKMATMQHRIFCVLEFTKTESVTAVQMLPVLPEGEGTLNIYKRHCEYNQM